ncbi:MAG: TIGR02594 family protein [Defluviimonas denitrificans]
MTENKIGPPAISANSALAKAASFARFWTKVPAIHAVRARRGLNLRRGPGTEFEVIETLPEGTLVQALGRSGEWVLVDCRGDGRADGYLFGGYLQPIAGGIEDPAAPGTPPYEIGLAEMRVGVAEVPGSGSNPRIVAYHATTSIGPAEDGVAWCSSFVNFCVTRAGLHGTNSAWAMSWDSDEIGADVTRSARPGDIAVFRRKWAVDGVRKTGGHVGFLVSEAEESLEVLGGNQGNRVGIRRYPRKGDLGGQHYELLSIRRVGGTPV